MKTQLYFKLFPTFCALFFSFSISAQSLGGLLKAVVVSGAALNSLSKGKGKLQKKDSVAAKTIHKGIVFIDTSKSYDLSGKWEGYQVNGQLIMYYQVCLFKIGKNVYSGTDSCRWIKNANNTPLKYQGTELPSSKKSFVGEFKGDLLNFSEISELGNSNWGLSSEKFKLIANNDTLSFINSNVNYSSRKFYLKHTGGYPEYDLKYVFNVSSLQIDTVTYHSPKPASNIKYNDKGYLELALNNKTANNFRNVNVDLLTPAAEGNILNSDVGKDPLNIEGNSKKNLGIGVNIGLMIPNDFIDFKAVLSVNGIPLTIKYFKVPTTPFFKTTKITNPIYTSARMQAISGYYGFLHNPYKNVPVALELLVASGDKIAEMWKAVFLSMGYGEYKIDEMQGYAIGKTCIKAVEDKARNGDAEAIYLMFYACQMGLEGEDTKLLAVNFLEKAATAGFKPAVYDYGNQFLWHKDYASANTYLTKSYEIGIEKAAEVIGLMYEKGFSVSSDIDSAIEWYKKGMTFGDPEAMLCYAKVMANGINNMPPNINKALGIATSAASKNCTEAMIFNGTLYFEGKRGVAQNFPLAIKWYKAGAEQGDRQAMLALGETYIADKGGMVKDVNSGLFWIKKAAELGSPKAMLILAKYYNEGTLGEKNIIAARYWYNQAVLNGFARQDATGINAGTQNFLNFWKYADFSPSYIYVNEYGEKVADGDDGLLNGFATGILSTVFSYYGNQQQLIDGLEYIFKRNGYKIYGGTVSSNFLSNLYLKRGQSIQIKSYGTVSTGMFSGAANADGLGNSWPEYRIVQNIPCSAVMAGVKDSDWQFIGQNKTYTAPKDGPLVIALNAIDYKNYKGYFDLVIEVPEN